MTIEECLERLLTKHLNKNAVVAIGIGTVKGVTPESCTVEREGQPPLYDVRLQAGGDLPGSHYTPMPSDGSAVVYGILGNQAQEAVLLMCSEIDGFTIKVQNTMYQVASGGHLIQKGSETLHSVIEDFIKEVKKIIVINGTSPNVAALTAINTRLNNLLQ